MAPFSNSAGASDTCFHRPGSTHNMNTLDRSLRCGHSNTINGEPPRPTRISALSRGAQFVSQQNAKKKKRPQQMIFFTFPRLARDWCIAASPPPLARGSGDERWTWCGLGWGHGNGGISPQTRVRRNPSCTMATRQGKKHKGKKKEKEGPHLPLPFVTFSLALTYPPSCFPSSLPLALLRSCHHSSTACADRQTHTLSFHLLGVSAVSGERVREAQDCLELKLVGASRDIAPPSLLCLFLQPLGGDQVFVFFSFVWFWLGFLGCRGDSRDGQRVGWVKGCSCFFFWLGENPMGGTRAVVLGSGRQGLVA